MKHIIPFLAFGCLVLVAYSDPASSTSHEAAIREQLIELEKQSWEAWKNRDGKFFQEFLSDDHVEMGFNGPANKAQIVTFVSSLACTVTSYKLDHFEMKMFDQNTALLTYWE